MEIIINPLEELLAAISLLLYSTFFGNVQICDALYCNLLIYVRIFFYVTLWYYGYRMTGWIYHLAGAVTAFLFVQYAIPVEESFLRIFLQLLIVVGFVVVAYSIDKFRGTFFFLISLCFVGQFMGSSIGLPPIGGVYVGAVVAMLLCFLPEVRKVIRIIFDCITAFITAIASGTILTMMIGEFIYFYMYSPSGEWLLREPFIIGTFLSLVLGGLALWGGTFYYSLKLQLQRISPEDAEESEVENKLSPKNIGQSFMVFLLTLYIIVNAQLLNSQAINTIPLSNELSASYPVDTWANYQRFSSSALRPWFNYPWEDLPSRQIEYYILAENGTDAYACPRLSCDVVKHFYAGFLTISSPNALSEGETTVGLFGFTGSANIVDRIESEAVLGDTTWYVFLTRDLRIVYMPSVYLEPERKPRETTDFPIITIGIAFIVAFLFFLFMRFYG